MRTLTYYMAALVSVLGIATASQAAVQIDFLVAGSDTVSANVSDTITVDIVLTVSGTDEVSSYQFTMLYDTSVVTTLSRTNPGPQFPNNIVWTVGGPPPGLFDNGDGDYGGIVSASTLFNGFEILAASGPVLIGTVTVHVDALGVGITGGCFNCATEGATGDNLLGDVALLAPDLTGVTSFGTLTIVPEPTTASLLGLGLLGLGVAGRRRN